MNKNNVKHKKNVENNKIINKYVFGSLAYANYDDCFGCIQFGLNEARCA